MELSLAPTFTSFAVRGIYHKLTFRYSGDGYNDLPALRSHEEVQAAVRFVRTHPTCTKREIISEFFANTPSHLQATDVSKGRAFDLVLSVLTTLPCSRRNPWQNQRSSVAAATWGEVQFACDVVDTAIPAESSLSHGQIDRIMAKVSAGKLNGSGWKMSSTSDIRQHLHTDSQKKRLYVYNQVGFLKACLRTKIQTIGTPRSAPQVQGEAFS